MPVIDIECSDSGSFLENCECIKGCGEQMILGRCFQIFLSVTIPCDFFGGYVKKATLILSKVPVFLKQEHNEYRCNSFMLLPLEDDYSPCKIDFCKHTDFSSHTHFCNMPCSPCTEIDITHLANAWLRGGVTNKHMIITGNQNSEVICYAASRHPIKEMRPKIRFACQKSCFCVDTQLSVAEANVEVKRIKHEGWIPLLNNSIAIAPAI